MIATKTDSQVAIGIAGRDAEPVDGGVGHGLHVVVDEVGVECFLSGRGPSGGAPQVGADHRRIHNVSTSEVSIDSVT